MFNLSKKEVILGTIVDDEKRELVAVRKKENLIIHIKANEEDIHKFNNYIGNYGIEVSYNSYSSNVMDDFGRKIKNYHDEDLKEFIYTFLYHYGRTEIVHNPYNKFFKNNILFTYILEAVSEQKDGKVYRWKV